MDDGEKFNAVTHLVGAVLALTSAALLQALGPVGFAWLAAGSACHYYASLRYVL